jgi:hypothetical protein
VDGTNSSETPDAQFATAVFRVCVQNATLLVDARAATVGALTPDVTELGSQLGQVRNRHGPTGDTSRLTGGPNGSCTQPLWFPWMVVLPRRSEVPADVTDS